MAGRTTGVLSGTALVLLSALSGCSGISQLFVRNLSSQAVDIEFRFRDGTGRTTKMKLWPHQAPAEVTDFFDTLPPMDIYLAKAGGRTERVPDPSLSPGLLKNTSSSEVYFLDVADEGAVYRDPNFFESRQSVLTFCLSAICLAPVALVAGVRFLRKRAQIDNA